MRSCLVIVSCFALVACSSDRFANPGDASTDANTTDAEGGVAEAGEAGDASASPWELLGAPPGDPFQIRALAIVGANDLWLAGGVNDKAALDHWVQGAHGVVSQPLYPTLQGIDMKGIAEGVAVTDGAFLTYNGQTWSGMNHSKGNLVGVWYSTKANTYYAANALGYDYQFKAGTFIDMSGAPTPGHTCNAMNSMVTACNAGVFVVYDDSANGFKSELTGPPTQTNFRGVDRRGSVTLAVGTGGAFADLAIVVGTYTVGDTGVKSTLNAVWVTSAGEAFAVGDGGVIVHRGANKTTWEVMPSPTTKTLRAIVGIESPLFSVYAAGDDGTLIRYVR